MGNKPSSSKSKRKGVNKMGCTGSKPTQATVPSGSAAEKAKAPPAPETTPADKLVAPQPQSEGELLSPLLVHLRGILFFLTAGLHHLLLHDFCDTIMLEDGSKIEVP
jgi:hypothetical protein